MNCFSTAKMSSSPLTQISSFLNFFEKESTPLSYLGMQNCPASAVVGPSFLFH